MTNGSEGLQQTRRVNHQLIMSEMMLLHPDNKSVVEEELVLELTFYFCCKN